MAEALGGSEQSMRNEITPARDPVGRGVERGKTGRRRCTSLAPKVGAVLAAVGLAALVGDAMGVVDALVGPPYSGPPVRSFIDVVLYVGPWLLTFLAGGLIAPMFAGWLSGRRGGLYGLVTAVCLSFPESALAFRSLASLPPDLLGDLGDFLPGGPWATIPSSLPTPCVPALCFLPTLAMLFLAWFGGYCGERMRLRQVGDSSA